MKKLKFLTLAAIAAATAMVSSCSDNVELSTSTKEAKGKCDLLVDVSVDGSRASAVPSTKFTTFKLFGYQNPPTGSSAAAQGFLNGASGVDFTGKIGNTWTTESEALWPTETDQSNNFYAISTYDGTTNSATLGNEFNTAGLQNGSFTYTSAISSYNPDYLNEAVLVDNGLDEEEIAALKVPSNYVNSAEQKDVVIAASMETLKGTTGKITLPFKHAFAYVTMEFNFASQVAKKDNEGNYTNDTPDGTGISENEYYAIDYIAIHGVKTKGTFTFTKSGDNWDGSWAASDYGVVKYVWGVENPLILHCSTETPTATNPIIYTPILTDGQAMMIIPQIVNTDGAIEWDEDTNLPSETPENKAYIEIHGALWQSTGDEDETKDTPYKTVAINHLSLDNYVADLGGDAENYLTQSLYCALPANFEFKMNKHYNFRIKLTSCLKADGTDFSEALNM
jgi:hypothetical protein